MLFLELMVVLWEGKGILDINFQFGHCHNGPDGSLLKLHTHTPKYTHTLSGVDRHADFLGSRPIHHVSVCRGAASHCLSLCLFFRNRPASYISLPFSLLLSLSLYPPPSLSSCLYICDTLPPSLTPFIYLDSLREQRGHS